MEATKSLQQELAEMNEQVVDQVNGRDVKRKQLEFWFNAVASKQNWKLAIDTTIYLDTDFDLELVKRAVVFFTGSIATVRKVPGERNLYRVRAAGYYATIGA